MNTDFTNLTTENLSNEHLCCIIRSKKPHPGIDAKRQWLSDRLKEGHVFRKLNAAKATVFIEYAPVMLINSASIWILPLAIPIPSATAFLFDCPNPEPIFLISHPLEVKPLLHI